MNGVYLPTRKVVVHKIQVNPIQVNMAFFMTLWIGNDAVLKSSSPWQLKEF